MKRSHAHVARLLGNLRDCQRRLPPKQAAGGCHLQMMAYVVCLELRGTHPLSVTLLGSAKDKSISHQAMEGTIKTMCAQHCVTVQDDFKLGATSQPDLTWQNKCQN